MIETAGQDAGRSNTRSWCRSFDSQERKRSIVYSHVPKHTTDSPGYSIPRELHFAHPPHTVVVLQVLFHTRQTLFYSIRTLFTTPLMILQHSRYVLLLTITTHFERQGTARKCNVLRPAAGGARWSPAHSASAGSKTIRSTRRDTFLQWNPIVLIILSWVCNTSTRTFFFFHNHPPVRKILVRQHWPPASLSQTKDFQEAR